MATTTAPKFNPGPASRKAAYEKQQAAMAQRLTDLRIRLVSAASDLDPERAAFWADALAEHDARYGTGA